LVGVITDRDIACRAIAAGSTNLPVRDVMTAPVFTVRDDEDVQAAIDLMEAKQVRRLPVVDAEGSVTGIVAPSDLAPIFASTNVADFLLAVSYWSRRPAAVYDRRPRLSDRRGRLSYMRFIRSMPAAPAMIASVASVGKNPVSTTPAQARTLSTMTA